MSFDPNLRPALWENEVVIKNGSKEVYVRRVYNNENISENYLNFQLAIIMKCDDSNKEKVINKIISLVNGQIGI